MIVILDDYRKSNATCAMGRSRYLDRSSYEEEILSARWAETERLMQTFNVSWNQAMRIIDLTSDRGRWEPSARFPETFTDVDVGGLWDRVYTPTSRL
jgi:hypothetical protein